MKKQKGIIVSPYDSIRFKRFYPNTYPNNLNSRTKKNNMLTNRIFMAPISSLKQETGFSASINNFTTTADEHRYFENSSDKLSALEIIKNDFFTIIPSEDSIDSSINFLAP